MTHVRATTKILIINERDELLILKIGVHTKQPHRSYTLDLPGGFVDDGESERDGAVREIKEETNIDMNPNDLELIWAETNYYEDTDASFTHLLYLVGLDHTPEVKVSWEHESFMWVKLDEAAEKFEDRPRFRHVVEYMQKLKLVSHEQAAQA